MGNPGYPPNVLQEALDAVERYGTVAAAAKATNTPYSTMEKRYKTAKRDPAIAASMNAVGTQMVPALAWLKTAPDGAGNSYSVMLKPAPEEVESFAERMKAALEGMAPAALIEAPAQVMDDLCSVYPVMDAHIGMHAWGRETGGQDYDIDLAAKDMRMAQVKVMALTPPAAQAVLILGGDTLHANDNQAETPKSKHRLDVDGRHFKVMETAIVIIAEMAERLAAKHGSVLVRVLRGNHDEESHLILTFALAERYRENPRITVEKDPRDLFMFRWGRCGIFANHGDRMRFQQIFNLLATVCRWWSETPHRHYLSGHYHKEKGEDIGGMRMETLRPFCPPDAYGAMWGGRRVMQSLTFDKTDGLVLRAFDPIERAA